MRIENVVALTRGDLKTTPPITYFEDIKLNYLQIRRGDLFIALNADEIKKAIYNGAYGIIYDAEDIEPSDSEVAFIKVRDASIAAFSLARYGMLKKSFRFVSVDPITLEIIKKIAKSKSVEFVDKNDIKSIFSLIKNEEATIVFGSDEEFLSELTTDSVEHFLAPKECKLQISSSTLFESNIFIDGTGIRVKLPEFQLKYLENAIKILRDTGIPFDISALSFTEFFDPVFVDSFLYAKEFGKTAKVIIFAKYTDNQILKETMNYLSKNTKWAKNLYIFPLSLQNIEDKENIITLYGSDRELLDMLEENDFNFAFVVNADKANLIKERKESSLFSFDF
jgi:ferrochelatase